MNRNAWMNSTSSCRPILLLVLGVFLASSGCAPTLPKVKTYEEAAKEVSARGALISPPIETREGYEEGTSVRLDKDKPAPYSGLLLDESKARLLVAIKGERDRRRAELEAEARKSAIQRIIYESTIEHLRAVADAKTSWWDRNKGLVGFAIGTTVGMAIIVGVMYALTGGKSLGTQSSALTTVPVR